MPLESPAMARLRFLLACLVMLATPLQGFASATMLSCTGMPGHHGASAAPAGHDLHGLADQAAAQVDNASRAGGGAEAPAANASACSACAVCCQSVAMTASLVMAPLPSVPRVHAQTRKPAVPSQPAVVPDKPPRA